MISTPDSSIRQQRALVRVDGSGRALKPTEREALQPPARRGFNVIPAPEVLEGLIDRALEALRAGIFWDRGSILNIVT